MGACPPQGSQPASWALADQFNNPCLGMTDVFCLSSTEAQVATGGTHPQAAFLSSLPFQQKARYPVYSSLRVSAPCSLQSLVVSRRCILME